MNKRWNCEGNKVRHRLAGWIGYIQLGNSVNLTKAGDTVPIAEVNFWDHFREELRTVVVVESEIEILGD